MAVGAGVAGADGDALLADGLDVVADEVGAGGRLVDALLEGVDLGCVGGERAAYGLLELVDGDKVGEVGQHVFDADRLVQFLAQRATCHHLELFLFIHSSPFFVVYTLAKKKCLRCFYRHLNKNTILMIQIKAS